MGLLSAAAAALGYLSGSLLVAAVFSVLVQMLLTGGMYLDGMAKLIATISASSVERKREVLQQCGLSTGGKVAITVILVAKFTFVWRMMEAASWQQTLMMITVVSVNSMYALVAAAAFSTETTIGDYWYWFIRSIGRAQWTITSVITLALLVVFVSFPVSLGLLAFAVGSAAIVVHRCKRALGGMVGAGMGIVYEGVQVCSYVFLFFALRSSFFPMQGFLPLFF